MEVGSVSVWKSGAPSTRAVVGAASGNSIGSSRRSPKPLRPVMSPSTEAISPCRRDQKLCKECTSVGDCLDNLSFLSVTTQGWSPSFHNKRNF
eukprot:1725980-Amphidinium_carterae.1